VNNSIRRRFEGGGPSARSRARRTGARYSERKETNVPDSQPTPMGGAAWKQRSTRLRHDKVARRPTTCSRHVHGAPWRPRAPNHPKIEESFVPPKIAGAHLGRRCVGSAFGATRIDSVAHLMPESRGQAGQAFRELGQPYRHSGIDKEFFYLLYSSSSRQSLGIAHLTAHAHDRGRSRARAHQRPDCGG
jgi:hypothetical protein